MSAPDLSIIVVSFNTRELLRACLVSLLGSEDWQVCGSMLKRADGGLSAEVIVVDNGSQDDSTALLIVEFPWVRLVANQENVGFARANNRGVSLATGRHVLLLNSDTETLPSAIGSMVEFMDGHEDAGALGCQLLNPDRSLQPSGGDFPNLRTIWLDLLPVPSGLRQATLSKTERRDFSQTCEVDEVSGAVMFLRRQALDVVGGLDEDFFFLGEDVDLCWKLREKGWKTYYLPAAQIVHHWGGSRAKSNNERISLLAQRALYLLYKKHRGVGTALLVKALLVPVTFLKLLKGLVLALAKGDLKTSWGKIPLFFEEMRWLWRN